MAPFAGKGAWAFMKAGGHSRPQQKAALSALTARLRGQLRKITGPRAAILNLLRGQAHPLSTRQILAAMPKGRCDLATVYRAMHLLQEMGMVRQYDFGDGAARFELVKEGEAGHHHHLVCTQCSKVVEIEECFPRELQSRIAAANGFTGVTHKLEFFGICPRCRR